MKYLFLLIFMIPIHKVESDRWGANGHRIVAKICYDNLTEQAKKQVDELLGDHYLEQVSNWPDFIKSEKPWGFASPWHYMTISADQTLEQTIEESAKDPKINNVFEGIEAMLAILRDDPEATQSFQAIVDKNKAKLLNGSIKASALAFLIHFIGDIHQPMHVGKNRDLGGNKIEVLYFSERENLHGIWDTDMIEREKLSFTEFSAFVEKHVHSYKAEWENDPIHEWVQESIELREEIYNTLYDNTDRTTGLPSFSYNYQHDFLPKIEKRLGAAGYRAAALLNEIYK